ncbi:hypothetical protein BS78_01G000300 [Paspalum vaginatum]|nr:hypothetical protein BS78_01G000300 [Paspalum vaginatum]
MRGMACSACFVATREEKAPAALGDCLASRVLSSVLVSSSPTHSYGRRSVIDSSPAIRRRTSDWKTIRRSIKHQYHQARSVEGLCVRLVWQQQSALAALGSPQVSSPPGRNCIKVKASGSVLSSIGNLASRLIGGMIFQKKSTRAG